MELENFSKDQQSRLFYIDQDCYVIYTGFHEHDEKPFLRLGYSNCLPDALFPHIQYSLVNDLVIGNLAEEKQVIVEASTLAEKKNLEKNQKKKGIPVGLQLFGNFKESFFLGNYQTIRNFEKYLGVSGLHFVSPKSFNRKPLGFRRGKSAQLEQDASLRENVFAYFYENHNIRIAIKKKTIFDLKTRTLKDLNPLNEMQVMKNFTQNLHLAGMQFGVFWHKENIIVYDQSKYLLWIKEANHNPIESAFLLHFFPKNLEAVVVPSASTDYLLQQLLRYPKAKSFQVFSDPGAHLDLLHLFQREDQHIDFHSNHTLRFSPGYFLSIQNNESRAQFSTGGDSTDLEISLNSDQYQSNARIVVLSNEPNFLQKERQLVIRPGALPAELLSPYLFVLPDGCRHEFRFINKTADIERLDAEWKQLWLQMDEKWVHKRKREEFSVEFFYCIEKLSEKVFQKIGITLPILPREAKTVLVGKGSEHPYTQILVFNRLFLRWQLSGKREPFSKFHLLRKWFDLGYRFYTLSVLFHDNQVLSCFLPEPYPLLYAQGVENPLFWRRDQICYDPGLGLIRDKIVARDSLFFEDLFQLKLQKTPLNRELKNLCSQEYKKWIAYYLQHYSLFLRDQKRLDEWLRHLAAAKDAAQEGFTTAEPVKGTLSPKSHLRWQHNISILIFMILLSSGVLFFSGVHRNHPPKAETSKDKFQSTQLRCEKSALRTFWRNYPKRIILPWFCLRDNQFFLGLDSLESDLFVLASRLPGGIQFVNALDQHQNFASYVWREVNIVAKKNGYQPLARMNRGKPDRMRNPHWVYPGKEILLPDGAVWQVKKGESIWAKIEANLKKKKHLTYFYLLQFDLEMQTILQKLEIPEVDRFIGLKTVSYLKNNKKELYPDRDKKVSLKNLEIVRSHLALARETLIKLELLVYTKEQERMLFFRKRLFHNITSQFLQ